MSDFSDQWETQINNDIFRTSPVAGAGARPTAVYVALCTTATSDSDTGSSISEPAGASYARVQVTQSDASWSVTNNTVANAGIIQFPTPTESWGTVTHFCLVDAATAGKMIAHSALTASRTIDIGADVQFAVGALTFTTD